MSAAATTRVLLQTISGVLLQTISNEKKKKEKLIICSGQWSGPRERERERDAQRGDGPMVRWSVAHRSVASHRSACMDVE